jgi:murein DD-endopeptidase MepM/ murein hydrolase activator NlpD
LHRIRRLAERLFPERQLFLRSDGRVRYLRLSQRLQVGVCGALLVGLLWSVFASGMYLVDGRVIQARNDEIENQRRTEEGLRERIAAYRERATEAARRPADQTAAVAEAPGGAPPDPANQDLPARLTRLADELQRMTEINFALTGRLDDVQALFETTRDDRDRIEAAHRAAAERLAAAQEELRHEREQAARLGKDLATVTERLASVTAERQQEAVAEKSEPPQVATLRGGRRSAAGEAAEPHRDGLALREHSLAAQPSNVGPERQPETPQSEALREMVRRESERVAWLRRDLEAAARRLDDAVTENRQVAAERQQLAQRNEILHEELRREVEQVARLRQDLDTADRHFDNAASENQRLTQRNEALHEGLRREFEQVARLRQDLDTADRRFDNAASETQRLAQRNEALHEELRREFEQVARLRQDLDTAGRRFDNAATDNQRLAQRNQTLQEALHGETEQVAALRDEFASVAARLDAATVAHRQAEAARRELAREYASLQQDLSQERTNATRLREDIAAATARRDDATPGAGDATAQSNLLRTRVHQLEQQLARAADTQQQVLARLTERTIRQIDRLEWLLDLTGVDPATLMAKAGISPQGQGGPFVAAGPVDPTIDPLKSTIAALDLHLNRWEGMSELFQHLPLVAPLDSYYVSSRFGVRSDPYTKKRAMHSGVDLAGVLRSPIYTTAPGIVTFAGRNGPNGLMVEIDHGMGVRTRYGHLHKTLVAKGQKVAFRQKIALMGNSGRSTGSHLHYEIWANGRPHNPTNFIEAGRYIFHDLPELRPADLKHPVRTKPRPKLRG